MIIHIEGNYNEETKEYDAKIDGVPGAFFSHTAFLPCVINVQAAFLTYLAERLLREETGVQPTLCFLVHPPKRLPEELVDAAQKTSPPPSESKEPEDNHGS